MQKFNNGNFGKQFRFHSFAHEIKMEIQEKILQGAAELFFKYGIKSITMDDIAKHVAVSKKTIYQHYDNKDKIVETMLMTELNCHQDDIKEIVSRTKNVIEEFILVMQHMEELFTQMNPNVFYDLQKHHSTIWSEFQKFKQDFMATTIKDSINRGIEEGFVRNDFDKDIITQLRISQIEMGFNPEIFPPSKYHVKDVQLSLLNHFLNGICTIKGQKLLEKHKAKLKLS